MTNQHWSGSPPVSRKQWHNGSDHSNEVENRLTTLEIATSSLSKANEAVASRMKWLERALQALAVAVYLLATGKLHELVPATAKLLVELLTKMLTK